MTTAPTTRASSTNAPASAWDLDRLLVVVGALSVLVGGLAFSGWSFANFAANLPELVPAAPGWIFAIVLAFFARPWVYLTAGILNAIMPLLVLFVFGAFFGLTEPLLGGEYQALMFLVLGLVLSLWGGIAGFMKARKKTLTPLAGALGTRKGVATLAIAVFVLGIVLTSGMASSAVKEMAAAGASYNVVPDEVLTVRTADFAFVPSTLNVPVGQVVEIAIVNEDSASHTFTYESGGRTFDTFLPGDSTTKILVRFDTAQTIHFWCKPHSGGAGDTSEDSMVGTIVVA